MTKLNDKIENALNEGRTLILGAQVLIGFQYQSVFQPGFVQLPFHAQLAKVGALGLLLLAFVLLASPAPFHRIVLDGEDRRALHTFTTGTVSIALLPFAIALAVATEKVYGASAGAAVGGISLLVAFCFWYGYEFLRRRTMSTARSSDTSASKPETQLSDKIKQALIESRMVLPGAQTLLGFQFTAMLTSTFDRLPVELRTVHLVSLGMIAIATILLMTPAAYHRIVLGGENTERFHRLASWMVIWSMVPLMLGMVGDFYVILVHVLSSTALATAISVVLLVIAYGLWFGYMLYRRSKRSLPRVVEASAGSRAGG